MAIFLIARGNKARGLCYGIYFTDQTKEIIREDGP